MKTFDYEAAWFELARPAYETLPADVRALLAYTAEAADGLAQLTDCSMPWPDADGEYRDLASRFERIPAEVLSHAARVINSVGHWYPSSAKGYAIPGLGTGAHWKFAHYADQSLRTRLGLAPRGMDTRGVSIEVHEGSLRLCYSSRETWTWQECQPATQSGLARARVLAAELKKALDDVGNKQPASDDIAHAFMATVKPKPEDWPSAYFMLDLSSYMRDESEIARRKVLPPVDWSAQLAKMNKFIDEKIAELQREREVLAWFLSHELPTDNVIYYRHSDEVCIGWSRALSREAWSQWVDRMGAECPFRYRYKFAEGFDPSRETVEAPATA